MITAKILQAIVGRLDDEEAQAIAEALNPAMEWAEINTLKREAAFIAQWAHETQGFTKLVENLNYSVHGLLAVFPRYFTEEQAEDYARQPERIANRVYANRMGNGDEESGDGWRYRGRGYPHLTGKDNYVRAGADLDLDLVNQPEMGEGHQIGAYLAAWFWNDRNLNRYADSGDFITLTRRINGGLNGLADRQKYWARAKEALGIA